MERTKPLMASFTYSVTESSCCSGNKFTSEAEPALATNFLGVGVGLGLG